MLPVLDYLLLCCVDFENKISIYLSIYLSRCTPLRVATRRAHSSEMVDDMLVTLS